MGSLKRCIIEDMEPKAEPPMEVLGWISVGERLPEDDQHVVAWDSQNKIAVVAYRFGESSWCMNAGDEYGFDAHAVTHWMPLPGPPEVPK